MMSALRALPGIVSPLLVANSFNLGIVRPAKLMSSALGLASALGFASYLSF